MIVHGAWTSCPFLRQDTWPTADGDRQHMNCRPAERNLHASTPAPEAASSACCLSDPNAPGPPRPCGHTTAKLLGGLQTGHSAIRQGWGGGGGCGWRVGEGQGRSEKEVVTMFWLHGLGMTNAFQALECSPPDLSRVLKGGR